MKFSSMVSNLTQGLCKRIIIFVLRPRNIRFRQSLREFIETHSIKKLKFTTRCENSTSWDAVRQGSIPKGIYLTRLIFLRSD